MRITCRVQENIIHGFLSRDDGTQVFVICKDVLGKIMRNQGERINRGDVFEIEADVKFLRWIVKRKG